MKRLLCLLNFHTWRHRSNRCVLSNGIAHLRPEKFCAVCGAVGVTNGMEPAE